MDQGDLYTIHGGDPLIAANSPAGSGLMTQGLSVKRGANFNFDLNDVATLNPYSGLSLQSWLSKISLKLKGIVVPYEALSCLDYSIFEQDEYEAFADVLCLLVQFPGIVKNSFRTLESSHILTLLFRVTDSLPDVWAADIDNQIKEAEEEEADHAGPNNTTGADPMDHFDTARAKQEHGDEIIESSLLNQPLQTGQWAKDDRLSKTEIEGGHSKAVEHSKSQANGLKDHENQQQLRQNRQEIVEETEAQTEGPVEMPDVETHLEANIQQEAIKDEGSSVTTVMNEVTGTEEQSTQEVDGEQDSEMSSNREEEQEQEGSEPVSTPLNFEAGEELNKHVEKSSEEEAPETAENALQGEAGENILLERALTKTGEDNGKGKGKERADQADDALQISPERLVKLAFYECVRQVLENGMRMVGLVPLDV
jgi:hypothetical protein